MQRMGWTYADYMETPQAVIDDILIVMEAEAIIGRAEEADGRRG